MLIKLEKIPSDVSVSLSNSGVAGFMNGDLLAASNDVLDGLMAGDDFRSELISWIKSTIDGNPNKSEIEKVLKHMYSTSEFDKYVKSIQKALDDGKTPNNNLQDVIKSLYF